MKQTFAKTFISWEEAEDERREKKRKGERRRRIITLQCDTTQTGTERRREGKEGRL